MKHFLGTTTKIGFFAFLFLLTHGVHAATLQFSGSTVIGATGVDVNGVLYDVTFESGTCADVYGAFQQENFDFQTAADALLAAQALVDQAFIPANNVDAEPGMLFGCADTPGAPQCFTHIVYGFDTLESKSVNARARNHEQEFLDTSIGNILLFESFDSTTDAITLGFTSANWACFTVTGGPDSDGDGVLDSTDNCTDVANADQLDTDGDNIGSLCDGDIALPNDCFVNFLDLDAMNQTFFATPLLPNWNADADFNGDNIVNFLDLNIVRNFFFQPPGPSANGCN